MEKVILGGGYTCSICGKYQRTSSICHHDNPIINNMKQLPTAKEFRISQCVTILQDLSNKDWEELMIEFAKLHVQAALESALEDAPYGSSTDTVSYKDMKDAILNAYPLDNIK